jgi:hypothetical protein
VAVDSAAIATSSATGEPDDSYDQLQDHDHKRQTEDGQLGWAPYHARADGTGSGAAYDSLATQEHQNGAYSYDSGGYTHDSAYTHDGGAHSYDNEAYTHDSGAACSHDSASHSYENGDYQESQASNWQQAQGCAWSPTPEFPWQKRTDPEGHAFYINSDTGITSRDVPYDAAAGHSSSHSQNQHWDPAVDPSTDSATLYQEGYHDVSYQSAERWYDTTESQYATHDHQELESSWQSYTHQSSGAGGPVRAAAAADNQRVSMSAAQSIRAMLTAQVQPGQSSSETETLTASNQIHSKEEKLDLVHSEGCRTDASDSFAASDPCAQQQSTREHTRSEVNTSRASEIEDVDLATSQIPKIQIPEVRSGRKPEDQTRRGQFSGSTRTNKSASRETPVKSLLTQPVRVMCRVCAHSTTRALGSQDDFTSEDGFSLTTCQQKNQIVLQHEGKTGGKTVTGRFSHCFLPTVSQAAVFQEVWKVAAARLSQGQNFSVIAYGQPQSGKSFSLWGPGTQACLGDPTLLGIAYRAIDAIFTESSSWYPDRTSPEENQSESGEILPVTETVRESVAVIISAIAVREDSLVDVVGTLESPGHSHTHPLKIPFGKSGGQSSTPEQTQKSPWAAVQRKHAKTAVEAKALLEQLAEFAQASAQCRKPAHLLVTIEVPGLANSAGVSPTFTLVDLATVQLFDAQGSRRRMSAVDTHRVQLSLSALGNVVRALQMGEHSSEIPFKHDLLTMLLSDSLCDGAHPTQPSCVTRALVLGHVSWDSVDRYETAGTLAYLNRLQKVLKPKT